MTINRWIYKELNAEQKEAIKFDGEEYTYSTNGRKGTHMLASKLLDGQLSYPSLVVLDSELNKVQIIRGYKSPEQLTKLLK